MGFIYLIQLTKHKNINVYKVGMTEQLNIKDRLNGYGKIGLDYFVEYFMRVHDAKKAEEKILQAFNQHFILYEGREWFMGNCNEMIDIIKEENNNLLIECEEIMNMSEIERKWKDQWIDVDVESIAHTLITCNYNNFFRAEGPRGDKYKFNYCIFKHVMNEKFENYYKTKKASDLFDEYIGQTFPEIFTYMGEGDYHVDDNLFEKLKTIYKMIED